MATKRSLPERLESLLGPIQEGWSRAPDGQLLSKIQVVAFGGTTRSPPVLSTLGLSDETLTSRQSRNRIRFELICPEGGDANLLAAIFFDVSGKIIQSGSAVLRGDCVSITGEGMGDWFGVYMSIPLFLDESNRQLEMGDSTVNLIWGIPVKRAEAKFIERAGWEKWEDILDANFSELGDLRRASFIA